MYLQKTLFLILFFIPNFSKAEESFGFWEGPNGYSYTREGLKAHIESASSRVSSEFNPEICSKPEYSQFMTKLRAYQSTVDKIKESVLSGPYQNKMYTTLVDFLDTFGPRLTGSAALEKSIDHLKDRFENLLTLDNVSTHAVAVPNWTRGEESAQLVSPVRKQLSILSLGQSVATPETGIRAEVVVFDNYTSLVQNVAKIPGKIVVCNFVGAEGDILNTQATGYPELAENGAVAALYKSAASFSLDTPHTRRANLYYNTVSREVPLAYLTTEDTAFLSRIYARGESLTIQLNIANEYRNDLTESRNLFGDWLGSDQNLQDDHIILSAHTDSWDVGQGAQDDGVGIYLVLQTMSLLNDLNLRPKRSIRSALWTAEEYGFNGSSTYIKEYPEAMGKLGLAMEADYACLANAGFIFQADYEGKLRPNNLMSHTELGCMMTAINEMLGDELTIGLVYQSDNYGTDLDRFTELEVPVVSLLGDDGRYFWHHHTESDTVTILNPIQLDYCLVSWATATYILADFDYSKGGPTSSANYLIVSSNSMQHIVIMMSIILFKYFW